LRYAANDDDIGACVSTNLSGSKIHDARNVIKPGMSAERTLKVTPNLTSGISCRPCRRCSRPDDDPGNGVDVRRRLSTRIWNRAGSRRRTEVDIRHLAASAVGAAIRTTARVIAVARRVIRFEVEAFDGARRIARASCAGLVNLGDLQQALRRG